MSSSLPKAIVLLSGGIDSSVLLAKLCEQFDCYAITFDYGQHSRAEIKAAKAIAHDRGVTHHCIFKVDIGQFGHSSLTDKHIDMPLGASEGVTSVYVPARNTVLLSIALAWAESVGAFHIFYGASAGDQIAFPDCRPIYINTFTALANLATRYAGVRDEFVIDAPFVGMSKTQIIELGSELNVDFAKTVTCYQLDPQSRACGKCESCTLRLEAFSDAGLHDPVAYQR